MKRGNIPGLIPEQAGGRRALALAISIGAHVAVAAALLGLTFSATQQAETESTRTMLVSLGPRPDPPGQAEAMEESAAAQEIVPTPVPQIPIPAVTIARPAADVSDLLSDAQVAGAARAGEGGAGGGGCDMAQAVQRVLRSDARVRAAVTEAGRAGKASLLWNGDWIRSGGQEGKGLAVVRQAIVWEVGFSPAACRNAPMHGMVLLSLQDGTTRFAIGAGTWRWSDLLGLRKASLQ